MKKLLFALLIVALITPVVAGEKKVVANDQNMAPITTNGRLAITPDVLNGSGVQIYVTPDGRIISPMPSDPALIPQWNATQIWIERNLDYLTRRVGMYRTETKFYPNRLALINARLQDELTRIGATAEVASIARTTETNTSFTTALSAVLAPAPQESLAYVAGCGPRGVLASQVRCCTTSCDAFGCDETSCSLCDCDAGGLGCCIYASFAAL